jgi:hypothetical protein
MNGWPHIIQVATSFIRVHAHIQLSDDNNEENEQTKTRKSGVEMKKRKFELKQ